MSRILPALVRRLAPPRAALFSTSSSNAAAASSSSSSSAGAGGPASAPKLYPEGNIYNPATARYKPKKVWPPDFSKLSEKQQFRFERRYKRRVKLATARPRWDKFVRLAQLLSCSFVLVYAVFWMDWEGENPPFEGIRQAVRNSFGSLAPEERHHRRQPEGLIAQQAAEKERGGR